MPTENQIPLPADPVETLKLLLAERRHQEAIAAWGDVKFDHPRFEGARLLLAESLLSVKPDLSLALLRDAVAYNPHSFKAAKLLSRAYTCAAARQK